MNRRNFITAAMATAASMAVNTSIAGTAVPRIKAIGFDGLALFDPHPVLATLSAISPGDSPAFAARWRDKVFEYTWLRTLTNSYVEFPVIADDALQFIADERKVRVTDAQRNQLKVALMSMKAWPDVAPALRQLKQQGLILAPLNDFSIPMLEASIRNSDLEGAFEKLLSTDLVKAYKPDPRAYQMATSAFGLHREETAFVAFAGWDAVGAKSFGYRTIWINRSGAPAEHLAVEPDAVASNFQAISSFVGL
ncbi:haloacid dehalogenase type II [Dyella mobilis]|uniref:(S)-2-haloacid dehalogenase n=1 Tax=Dyella mobilis TaxID=1849582 RepID=A0ABS2KF72_9GAMM|nr:haloacid dehalogenase type II [Dyella mobilis]MBM7129008.1 haloacid dehalogenase type II [Dyella mobilis]GLQ99296.1 haloacid dehalogenase [Dyella mobilis]